jgi:hypothetical protein
VRATHRVSTRFRSSSRIRRVVYRLTRRGPGAFRRRPAIRLDKDHGATLVEAAIVLPIAILMIMAVAEFSLAFKDWLTISNAGREGARAAATYGDDPRADILILEAIGSNLTAAHKSGIKNVEIGNPDTGTSTVYSYTPGPTCDWTPCPDPDVGPPLYTPPDWLPSTRDVALPNTDRITVRVEYIHTWVTAFFADTSDFDAEITMRIEPQVFES